MSARLLDRKEAGQQLAGRLKAYAYQPDVLVLALPRGGVPVAFEIAKALHCELDVFLVRKIGMPGQEEFAIGALASGGICVMNEEAMAQFAPSEGEVDRVVMREQQELERRERLYRAGRAPQDVAGRHVIVVDDGLATGSTMRAAIKALRRRMPARITVAVPVAPPSVRRDLQDADEVVCLMTPEPFISVSMHYRYFNQTSDAEVQELLSRAAQFGKPVMA